MKQNFEKKIREEKKNRATENNITYVPGITTTDQPEV